MTRQQQALSTGPTLADQAYGALRDEIISGRLKPGERLTERHLAKLLGVSPTPIREALQRLEHEHLIERTETRRIQVAQPSRRLLYELVLVEAALRGVAAKLAAENATDKELAAIEKTHRQFTDVALSPEQALKTTRRMHELIDRASHNEALVRMIATATAFDLRFRLDTVPDIYGQSPKTALERHREHGKIVKALKARDGKVAEELMRSHIIGANDALLQALAARESD